MSNRVSSWLDRRPSIRVVWLQWLNLWSRWPLAAGVLVCTFLALGALGRITAVVYVVALAALSPRFVLVVTTMLCALLALRHRRRLELYGHRHWLAALPANLSVTVRTAAAPGAIWLAGAALIGALSVVAGLPAWVPLRLLAQCALGAVLGVALAAAIAAVGTWRARGGGRAPRTLPRSRYVVARRTGRVSLGPLADLPLADAHVLDRAKIGSRSLLLLLLAVPMGTSGGAALAAAVAWLVVLHLINLLLALARTALGASLWLAPTPLTPVRFALALSHRIFGAQILAISALIAIAYVTIGATALGTVCTIAGAWLGAVAVLGTMMCVVALRTRSIAASPLHRWSR